MSFQIMKPGEYKTRGGSRIVITKNNHRTQYPWGGYFTNEPAVLEDWTNDGVYNINNPQLGNHDIIGFWEETPAETATTPIGFKKDSGKPKASLLPLNALMEVTKGFTKAMAPGSKYPPHNYRHGMDWTRPANAGFRHLVAWLNGQDNDSESGDNHLTSAIASLMMVLEMQLTNVGTDDRWPKVVEEQRRDNSLRSSQHKPTSGVPD